MLLLLFLGLILRVFIVKYVKLQSTLSDKRYKFPFYLVHSNVWGPSSILKVFGARWLI